MGKPGGGIFQCCVKILPSKVVNWVWKDKWLEQKGGNGRTEKTESLREELDPRMGRSMRTKSK